MNGGDSRGGSIPGIFVNVQSFIICSNTMHFRKHYFATHAGPCCLTVSYAQTSLNQYKELAFCSL